MFPVNGKSPRIQVYRDEQSSPQAHTYVQQSKRKLELHRLFVSLVSHKWIRAESLHSPLPSLRGVELKFLKVDTAGVKTTRGATRDRMAVLGIARRALGNRRDMMANM